MTARSSSIRPIVVAVACAGLILTAGSFALARFFGEESARAGLSTALGGAIATVNLVALHWIYGRMMGEPPQEGDGIGAEDAPPPPPPRSGGLPGLALAKTVGMFALFFVLLGATFVSPLALLIGYGALPVGIVASTWIGRTRV
jgi:hypothetical protein